MKKILCLLVALMMVFSMAACGEEEKPESGQENKTEEASAPEATGEESSEDEISGEIEEKEEEENKEETKEEKEDGTDVTISKKNSGIKSTAKPGEHREASLLKYQGLITENDTAHEYPFRLNDSGMVVLKHTGKNIETTNLKIHNKDGNAVWRESASWNSTSKQISYTKEIELVAGDYILYVEKYRGTGEFGIEAKHVTAGESFAESPSSSDNTFDKANAIKPGETIYGQLAVNDNIDTYTFEIPKSGSNELTVKAENIESMNIKLYDQDGKELWSKTPYWNTTSKFISFNEKIELMSGKYYFTVSEHRGKGDYQFSFKYTSAEETFAEGYGESDNEFARARAINVKQRYIGHLGINDRIDTYSFSIAADSNCEIQVNAQNIENVTIKIYNEDGKEIWGKSPYWNPTIKKLTVKEKVDLSKGSYYISVSEYRGLGAYDLTIMN